MIYTVFRGRADELGLLERGLREEAAGCTEEYVNVVRLSDYKSLLEFLKKKELADIVCVDVSEPKGIEQAELLRSGFPLGTLIVIAEAQMSPVAYLKPGIMAASLLLKPLRTDRIRGVFREILQQFSAQPEGEVFLLETREDRQRIPYERILYFEARAKKIYVCTEDREYGFYDTMDALAERLTDGFVRCHRSYLVNRSCIERIQLSAGSLRLRGNIEIPLSRSYKGNFKEIG